MFTAYVFEAKSIQSYVLEGGKLKDMVGASNLLDAACDRLGATTTGALLDSVLRAVPELTDENFTRRAGGALIVVHRDGTLIERFRMAWQIAFQQHLPCMEFTDAVATGSDVVAAIAAATRVALPTRNIVSLQLPIAHPLMQIAPRTGTPATDRSKREKEFVDETTRRKRTHSVAGEMHRDFIAEKFVSEALRKRGQFVWPVSMDRSEGEEAGDYAFPLLAESSYVGIVHADGNGMGQALLDLRAAIGNRPDAPSIMRAFSTAVVQSMQQAVQDATIAVLEPRAVKRGNVHVMPARPLVLAGDDVTLIIRGDLAVDFAASLVRQFRKATNARFGKLWRDFRIRDMPTELSAGAGVAFVKAHQPFGLAYGLAEQLAKYAKDRAKAIRKSPSQMPEATIAFHRVTTTFIDDYKTVRARELTITLGGTLHLLTCNPYSVEPKSSLPLLQDLQALRDLIASDALSRGPLRQLADLFQHDAAGANKMFERWLSVTNDSELGMRAKQELEGILQRLGANSEDGRGVHALFTAAKATPLIDAMQLHMATRGGAR